MEIALSTAIPAALTEQAVHFIQHSKAENTVSAYRSDWRHFIAWCEQHGALALPAAPATVASYAASLAADMKPATIVRRLAAISKAHQVAGYESPATMKNAVVAEVMAGIRRTVGTRQDGMAALMTADLRRLLTELPDNKLGKRDAAILLLGFAGGLRASEIVGLDVADVEDTADGLRISLRRSKTDQEGAGRVVGVPFGSDPDTCPVRYGYRRWQAALAADGLTSGSLFRGIDRHGNIASERLTRQVVFLVVRRYCDAAGLKSARFGAHSLRAGMATQAAANGASERSIMRQTGHKSAVMVRRYIREGSLFRDNAGARLGL
jgi:site-specific recombinase XerD